MTEDDLKPEREIRDDLPWMTVKEIRDICRKEGFYFSKQKGDRIVLFFETQIRHVEGELGRQLIKLEKWQRRKMRRAFGWQQKVPRPEGVYGPLPRSGSWRFQRVVNEIWLEIPRKNGKSLVASGICLYLLLADSEKGAKVVCAAAEKEQAKQIYKVCYQNVVYNNNFLKKVGEPYLNTISVPKTSSELNILTSKAKTKHGLNLSGIAIDEVHVHPSRELIDVLNTGTSARHQPLTLYTTTAGEIGDNIGYELHNYALMILNREHVDYNFFPIIYAADPLDDWTDREVWKKANPNLGAGKHMAYMEKRFKKAQGSLAAAASFKQLELNIWGEQSTKWIILRRWRENKRDFKLEDVKHLDCFVGVDLSSTTDMTSIVYLFCDVNAGVSEEGYINLDCVYKVLPFFWLPEDRLITDTEKVTKLYKEWHRKGHLQITEGETVDYNVMRKHLSDFRDILNIHAVVLDRWNATQFARDIAEVDGHNVIAWGQGFASMNSPTKEIEALYRARKLHHDGHPILEYNAKCARIKKDPSGNWKIDKEKSRGKVDGLVALANALGVAMKTNAYNVYNERGLLEL